MRKVGAYGPVEELVGPGPRQSIRMQPIGRPLLSLNPAMAFLAFVAERASGR